MNNTRILVDTIINERGFLMKSICIKTNNIKNIDYLLNLIDTIDLDDVYYSSKQFKNYKNIIIHYTGINTKVFYSEIATVLSYLVIDNIEDIIIKNLIKSNYFYFDSTERQIIFDICSELLIEQPIEKRFDALYTSFFDYISTEKNLLLSGFITFRLFDYVSELNSIIDTSVNKFIIEREYIEFISLFKIYIKSQPYTTAKVHLIYNNQQSTLLDDKHNLIVVNDNIFNAKYLSDITFSSNDYALNTLLSLVPKNIVVHLIDNNEDEFIKTLKLVFEDRIEICKNCDLCKLYRNDINFSKSKTN